MRHRPFGLAVIKPLLGLWANHQLNWWLLTGLNKIKTFLALRSYECVILDSHICPDLDMYKILEIGFKYVGISVRNMDTLELDSRIHYEKYVNFLNNLYFKSFYGSLI